MLPTYGFLVIKIFCYFSFRRYGDFVPSNKLSQFLMLFWILAGLVVMGLITGVIASGMTVGDISGEISLYGTKVSFIF